MIMAGIMSLTGCKYSIDNLIFDGMINQEQVKFERVGNIYPSSYILSIGETRYIDNVSFPSTNYVFAPEYANTPRGRREVKKEDLTKVRHYLTQILLQKSIKAIENITKV